MDYILIRPIDHSTNQRIKENDASAKQINNGQGDDQKWDHRTDHAEKKGVAENKNIQLGSGSVQLFKKCSGFKPGVYLVFEQSHFLGCNQQNNTDYKAESTSDSCNPGKGKKDNLNRLKIFLRTQKHIGEFGDVDIEDEKNKRKGRACNEAQANNYVMAVNKRLCWNTLVQNIRGRPDRDAAVEKNSEGFCQAGRKQKQ